MKKPSNTILKTILIAVLLVPFMATFALADGELSAVPRLGSEINSVYRIFRSVSIAAGTVSFAIGAIRLMIAATDSDEAQRAKKQMLYTLLAVAALVLLPTVIRWSISAAKSAGLVYDPGTPDVPNWLS